MLILNLSLSPPSIPKIYLVVIDLRLITASFVVFVLLIVSPTDDELPVIVISSVDNVPDKVPPLIAPVVVIEELPLLISPNPLVIVPPSNAPTEVIFVCATVDKVPDKVPPLIAPVVVIEELPLLISPNPLVIVPPSNAPTDVICVCDASTDNVCAVPSPLVAAVDVNPVPPVIVET